MNESLLTLRVPHWCFSWFLNCKDGTKLSKAARKLLLSLHINVVAFQDLSRPAQEIVRKAPFYN